MKSAQQPLGANINMNAVYFPRQAYIRSLDPDMTMPIEELRRKVAESMPTAPEHTCMLWRIYLEISIYSRLWTYIRDILLLLGAGGSMVGSCMAQVHMRGMLLQWLLLAHYAPGSRVQCRSQDVCRVHRPRGSCEMQEGSASSAWGT